MWGTRYQVYDRRGALRYAEDSASNERTEYIQLSGQLVAERTRALNASAATVAYLHSDHRGTPSVKTASNRDVIYRSWNDAYGEPHDHLWRDGPGFTGHAMDAANQLVYMQQRYHDPETGFISPDPVSADHGSFNRYWYANNNPYRFVDPDGRFPGGREFELDNKRLGVQPPPRDANDWLGPAIGVGLTAMAIPIAAVVGVEVGIAALSNPAAIATVGEIAADVAGVTGVATGAKALASSEIRTMVGAANKPFNSTGLSVAARKLEQHATRPGGTFTAPTGNVAQRNNMASETVQGILEHPNAVRTDLSRGGFEYRLPNGQGVRFDADGAFNTFLDPKR